MLAVMCAGMFLVLLDVTVVNVAVPSIVTGLRTTTAGVQWAVDGYTVALASLLLASGALGDRLGHRQVVAVGLMIFGAASAGCALAPSASVLVAARAAQGAGAAMLLPGSIAAIADAYPGRAAQARALGIWAGVSSLALPAGPLLGGLLISTSGWRAVFWVNLPVTAICLAGVLAWVRTSGERPRRRLDPAGLGLGTVALAAVVYAVIDARAAAVAAAAAGAVGMAAVIALVLVERRVAAPLLPPGLFRRPAFAAANASAFVMNLTSNGLLFLLTRYLQSVLGRSALGAGRWDHAAVPVRSSRRSLPAGRQAYGPPRPPAGPARRGGAGRHRAALPAARQHDQHLPAAGPGPDRRRPRGRLVHRARRRDRDPVRPG